MEGNAIHVYEYKYEANTLGYDCFNENSSLEASSLQIVIEILGIWYEIWNHVSSSTWVLWKRKLFTWYWFPIDLNLLIKCTGDLG